MIRRLWLTVGLFLCLYISCWVSFTVVWWHLSRSVLRGCAWLGFRVIAGTFFFAPDSDEFTRWHTHKRNNKRRHLLCSLQVGVTSDVVGPSSTVPFPPSDSVIRKVCVKKKSTKRVVWSSLCRWRGSALFNRKAFRDPQQLYGYNVQKLGTGEHLVGDCKSQLISVTKPESYFRSIATTLLVKTSLFVYCQRLYVTAFFFTEGAIRLKYYKILMIKGDCLRYRWKGYRELRGSYRKSWATIFL